MIKTKLNGLIKNSELTMNETRKNHPDTVANPKCSHCQQPVCAECQLPAGQQYFCSRKCRLLYYLDKIWNGIKLVPEWLLLQVLNLLLMISTLFKKIRHVNSRTYLDILFTVGIILSLIVSIYLYKKVTQIDIKLESLVSKTKTPNLKPPAKKADPELNIISPRSNSMVLNNEVTIIGEAQTNTIISLLRDSTILAVTIPENGKFSFPKILAKRGQNNFVVKALTPDGKSNTIQEIQFTYSSPTLNFRARDWTHGNINRNNIALTFDGDYLDNAAEPILDILKSKNVKCSFFLTGRFITKYPETVKRFIKDGHEIGNHTWRHPHLTTYAQNRQHNTCQAITRKYLHQQLEMTARVFRELTGIEMARLWRAPYGEHNRQIRLWAAELGYRQIGWTTGTNWRDSMDTMDWVADKNSNTYLTAGEIAQKILSFGNGRTGGANGAIVLMHLGTNRTDDFPYEKLPDIIDGLRQQGYKLVTVTELIGY
ncbi:MAG: polysaccharide deacetylase family protein [Methanosarcinaceae archaeon]